MIFHWKIQQSMILPVSMMYFSCELCAQQAERLFMTLTILDDFTRCKSILVRDVLYKVIECARIFFGI